MEKELTEYEKKREKERKFEKYAIITGCVLIPFLVLWFFYYDYRKEPIEEPQQVEAQYQDFDSTVWTPHKIKYMNIEQHAIENLYQLGFEDGTNANITWNQYRKYNVGDSVTIGETQTYRRTFN